MNEMSPDESSRNENPLNGEKLKTPVRKEG